MFLFLKVKSDSKCNEFYVFKSSLDEELEQVFSSAVAKKLESENLIDRLNNTMMNIIHNNKIYYAFVDIRHISNEILIVVLLDDSPSYLELFQNEIKLYLNDKLKEDLYTLNLDWKNTCVMYLPQFIYRYKLILPEIIYAAVQGYPFEFNGILDKDIQDLNRFICCLCILDSKDKQKSDTTVIIEQENGSLCCSIKASNKACHNITKRLLENESSIILKGILNDFILEVNKDLNIVRRMLNKAVGDFYVNYQLYKYISSSDKSEILHHHLALNEDLSFKEKEVLNLTIQLVKEKEKL